MFMGSYDHSLDAKGRMTIPSKFREALGDKFVITKSPDPCLCIYDLPSRVLIPQKLREHAHIEKNVVLMGVGARIEVWDPDTFDSDGLGEDINEIAEEMLGNGFII